MSLKLLKIFIAVSLLANILLLGIAFGHMGRSIVGLQCGKSIRHRVNVHELVMVLPEEKQKRIQPDMVKFDESEKQMDAKLMEERLKAVSLIEAKPFDKAALLAQIKALDNLHSDRAVRIGDMIAEITEQCSSDQEREELAARLKAMMLDKPADKEVK